MASKLSALLTFVLLIACASAQTMITTCQELQNMNLDLAGDYALANDIDCSDTVSWNGGAGFGPVGGSSSRFTGTLDGSNHVISSLTINRPSTDYVGLFGYMSSTAVINSLGMLAGSILGKGRVGGLVGENFGSISNSYTTGNVMGSNRVGGLVGNNDGSISGSYAGGSVTGSSSYIGGLVGSNYKQGAITDSYARGSVTGSSSFVGGLVGEDFGTIDNSYATGNVMGSSNSVGGLVGAHYQRPISNSYATGSVTSGSTSVGGLLGYNGGGATISNSYATGSVTGLTRVGGLVGNNFDGIFSHSYAIGSVISSGDDVGGLLGLSSGTTGGSYWDTQTSGQTVSAGGTPKTTAEMYQQATFVEWDFISTWQIDEGNDYPKLQSSIAPAQSSVPSDMPLKTVSWTPVPTPSQTPSETPLLNPTPVNSAPPSSTPVPTENQTAPGGGSNDDLSGGAIAGIAIGSAAGAAGLGAGLFVAAKKFGFTSFLGKSKAVTPMQPISNA